MDMDQLGLAFSELGSSGACLDGVVAKLDLIAEGGVVADEVGIGGGPGPDPDSFPGKGVEAVGAKADHEGREGIAIGEVF